MIVQPKIRGFICTTAHPTGCAQHVRLQAQYAKDHPAPSPGPRRVLVLGCSTGYGLASRIAAAFSHGADTIGVCLERPASGSRTASAGWYNNQAFEELAREDGLVAETVMGDAFSQQAKEDTIRLIRDQLPGGQVDLVVYSIAAPRRTHPKTGQVHTSVIKPIGAPFEGMTVNAQTGELSQVLVEPASPEEIQDTVAVMGGEDWRFWMEALQQADCLASGVQTVAFSYLGPSVTHPIYMDGTIGKAKEDLEGQAKEMTALLAEQKGSAFLSVNKALVTQASSAIPVVPLYISLLYRVMKEQGLHEDCIAQMVRMLDVIYSSGSAFPTDSQGRLRMDDWEMKQEVQQEVDRLWQQVSSENLSQLADLEGYRQDFLRLFGFGLEGVDYQQEISL